MKVYKVCIDRISLSYRDKSNCDAFHTISLKRNDIFFIIEDFYILDGDKYSKKNMLKKIYYEKTTLKSEFTVNKDWELIDNINLIDPYVSWFNESVGYYIKDYSFQDKKFVEDVSIRYNRDYKINKILNKRLK